MIAQLRDVGLARERRLVQRLDVREAHRELEPFEIDPPVDDRVEHEAVVRAGREAERQRHACSRMLRRGRRQACDRLVQLPRRAVAPFDDVRHRAHLRERRRPWIRQAYMNAAPSMLSTCGWKRATTAAIDRSLP